MNLMYCGDRNVERGVLLSVLSILRHMADPIHVHILTATIEAPGKTFLPVEAAFVERLEGLVRETNPQSSVALHDVTSLFRAAPPQANMRSRFTPCCMLRLYADQVPDLPDKVLYLDYDVLANAPLDGLWATDVSGVEFAGVLDHYGSWFFRRDLLRRDYMNSGVLLLNLAAIRESGLFARCRARCAQSRMFMPDQSALNMLADRRLELPRRFNEQRRYSPDTVLQHFSTSFRFFPYVHTVSVKPWEVGRMHSVLKLHAYDDLLERFGQVSKDFGFGSTDGNEE